MGNSYNGYTWKQREEILHARERLEPNSPRRFYMQSKGPCEICGDPGEPSHPLTQRHSEDYSRPYLFCPPATYILCNVCHSRLHKRFPNQSGKSSDWKVYLAHLRSGGYGREFTAYSLKERGAWQTQIEAGKSITLQSEHPRELTGQEWWQILSLDRESLDAPWARPRPWIERPSTEAYKAALEQVQPNSEELALLKAHANSARRCATMRQLAGSALSSCLPSDANSKYGKLAHRLADALGSAWVPEKRKDGTFKWMTTVAEGWKPVKREFEWVMIPNLAAIFMEVKVDNTQPALSVTDA